MLKKSVQIPKPPWVLSHPSPLPICPVPARVLFLEGLSEIPPHAPCWGLQLRSGIGSGSRDPLYWPCLLRRPFWESACWLTHSRTQHSWKLDSITGFLLPKLQRIGKETFPVPFTQCWNWLESTVDYGQTYKALILSRSGSVKWRAYLKQIQILLAPLGSAHLDQAFPWHGFSQEASWLGNQMATVESLEGKAEKPAWNQHSVSILGAVVMAFPILLYWLLGRY